MGSGELRTNPKLRTNFIVDILLCYDMVSYWLAKQEPDGPRGYPITQLQRDGSTVWDGVHNNLALKHMRMMEPNDLIMYYHTGKERQAVGVMRVTSKPYANPEESNLRFIVVDVEFDHIFKKPVTLEQMRQRPEFAGWQMLRIGRLSVVPVPPLIWDIIISLSKE